MDRAQLTHKRHLPHQAETVLHTHTNTKLIFFTFFVHSVFHATATLRVNKRLRMLARIPWLSMSQMSMK